jgi:uncharacterized protein (TIGR02147 family)
MAQIYQAKGYREYLREELDSPALGRGARSRLADHLGVGLSLISIVLAGKQNFSLEHAFRITEFLGLGPRESEYFILLVQWERAGSENLRHLFHTQILRIQKEMSRVTARAPKTERTVGKDELLEYYGSWDHSAVHMCLRNPATQDYASIGKRLGIDLARVKKSIAVLEKIGFIQRKKGRFVVVDQHFHFGEHSPALRMLHLNSRNAAIRSLDDEKKSDLHYSVLVSADSDSRRKLRELLLELVGKTQELFQHAKDEELFALNLDLFDL